MRRVTKFSYFTLDGEGKSLRAPKLVDKSPSVGRGTAQWLRASRSAKDLLLEGYTHMKKIALSLVLATGLSLAACSKPAEPAAPAAEATPEAGADGAMAEGAAATGDAAMKTGDEAMKSGDETMKAGHEAMMKSGDEAMKSGDAAMKAGEAAK